MPLALFDLDNTLVDREAAFARWARHVATTHGRDDLTEAIIALDGDGLTPRLELIEWLRTTLQLTSSVEHLLADYHDTYPTFFEVPDATFEALAHLRRAEWKIGVVTNGPPSQMRKLEVTGLVDAVDAVCVSAMVGATKPDPAIFYEAARRCATTLTGWMVGDAVDADVGGGDGVGLRTVWMTRGRSWPDRAFAPTRVADSIPDAVRHLLDDDAR